MTDQLPVAPGKDPSSTRVELIDPATVRISPINPRFNTPDDADSVASLAAELMAAGQISNAHAEIGEHGVYELLTGSRRQACILNSSKLRIQVYTGLLRDRALATAYHDDREAVTSSFWDVAGGWAKLLANGMVKSDTVLAQMSASTRER